MKRPARGSFWTLSQTFLVLLASRVVGLLREISISAAFGFSRVTDLFFQATFPLTSLLTVSNGPFTTAFAARLNQVPEAARPAHVRYYAERCWRLGALLASLYVLAGIGFLAVPLVPIGRAWLAVLVLAPAAFSLCYSGFVYAVMTAIGRITAAAIVMFISNAGFVIWIGIIWWSGRALEAWMLPLGYSLAAAASLLAARAVLRATYVPHPDASAPAGAKLPGLVSSFGYAGAETAVFILGQLVVISLATAEGAGWASGAALAQRIAFSVNGLIISPMASLLMLSIVNSAAGRLAAFLKGTLGAMAGLAAFAVMLVLGTDLLLAEAVRRGAFPAGSAAILMALLPSFALWLVPMGTNIVVCRTMFGLQMDRTYTAVTITAYLLANAVRLLATPAYGFPAALIGGALVEFAAVLVLIGLVAAKLLGASRRKAGGLDATP